MSAERDDTTSEDLTGIEPAELEQGEEQDNDDPLEEPDADS